MIIYKSVLRRSPDMYDQILVPVDGNPPSITALEHAADVAADVHGSLHVVNVTVGAEPESDTRAEKIIDEAVDRLDDVDVSVTTEIRSGEPIEEIVGAAAGAEVDAIVLGSLGRRGVRRLLLGSVAEGVVRDAEVPVIVVPASEEVECKYPYETIVVGVDGSEHASAALDRAIEIAARQNAALHLVSVVELPSVQIDGQLDGPLDVLESTAEQALEEGATRARERGVDDVNTDIRIGSADRILRNCADEQDADLVVVGTHGRSGVDRLLLGSVSERVLRTATAPVLTVGPWAIE
jgi:nucleotide-binding universal stress UspA family protein